MSDDRDPTDASHEARRLIDFRILALERGREQQEERLRTVESNVTTMKALLENVDGKLDRMQRSADEAASQAIATRESANTAAWRNFWTAAIGVFLVICTVIGTHYFK